MDPGENYVYRSVRRAIQYDVLLTALLYFFLSPNGLSLASLSESFLFLLTNDVDRVRPRIASCQSALIHGHLGYLHELAIFPYSLQRRDPVENERDKNRGRHVQVQLDPSHKVTLIENLVYSPQPEHQREDKESSLEHAGTFTCTK